jgi:hypothetical protein
LKIAIIILSRRIDARIGARRLAEVTRAGGGLFQAAAGFVRGTTALTGHTTGSRPQEAVDQPRQGEARPQAPRGWASMWRTASWKLPRFT